MIQPQIQQGLERLFINDGARVVLWHDAAQEFVASVGELSVDGVDILRLDEIGSLEAKIHIESGGKEQRYLVYAPFEEPAADNDWLLDIRLYGRSFRADSVSILFDELGLSSQALRTHLASRQKFLRAKDRVERLKKWVAAQDSESALDLKMLAVLTRAEQADSFSVLTKLYIALANESGSDLFQMTKQWQEIISLDLEQAFWDLMGRTFGYVQDAPSLMDLLLRLMVTDFSLSVRGALPQALKSFVLPEYSLAATAAVFMSQWRNNVTAAAAYDQLSRRAAGELKIADHLGSIDHGVLADAMTFEDIEKALFRDLRDRVVSESPDLKLAEIRELIQRRRDGHWTSPMRRGDGLNAFRIGYDAIEAAAGLLLLKAESSLSFAYSSAADAIRSYLDSLYRFDQLYRHFHEAADVVEMAGWDVLKSLQSRVEEAYSGWFIPHLANAWGSLFAGEQGLLRNWMAYGVQSQTQFYASHVAPVLEQSPRSKVYVLISDAFRYEAAEELTQELNGKYRVGATLTAQLGVLPSYTALGMAALLPHTQLAYKQSLDVLVDGRSSTGIEQRGKILADHGGVAIHASDLMAMNKDAGREFVKGRRVIYIYHNQVDAVGDSASTESKTFAAVRTAIRELTSLVRFIIDSLNGTTVLVTADHGFLYQDSALDAFDKSALDEKPAGTIKAKKRYLIGQALGEHPKAWCGNTRITAGMDPGMEFWVPKGANRFHFTGGARFTHGGAMPQEILVPVITVRELEGRAAERTAIRKVDVSLLGSTKKIVNNVQRFEFIQNDAVSERIHSRTLLISLRDGNELISNEVTLTFNSTSEKIDERKQTARITLQAGQYPKTGTYALVLIDADTKVEIDRVSFTIDLAISNDF
ncbi:MAG: BREX-1 system phosphatase PglZ type A [Gammaproteobacteria bacterium]|nr:BREX-1 system phosphatase PglZ type A [Gammaproteobacteria bacterium]